MGSTTVESSSTTKPKATAEETEMNKILLQRMKDTAGQQTQLQQTALGLGQNILSGNENAMPDWYKKMYSISPQAMSTQAANMVRSGQTSAQSMGIGDSGEMWKAITNDVANNLVYPAEQFNIGAKQNLLNLALSGQAQVQAPVVSNTNTLANQLAGLRTTQTSGTQTQSANPFSLIAQGLGTGIGMWAGMK